MNQKNHLGYLQYATDISSYLYLNSQLHREQRLLTKTPPGPQRDRLLQNISNLKQKIKELNKRLNEITA